MTPSFLGVAGELISTTTDLNRFFAALLDGRLLPPHLLHAMTTPAIPGAHYGLGLFLKQTSCGVPLYGHDGDALAHQSWSYSTLDHRHQVTLALTPNFHADVDATVDTFISKGVCG
jgi:D-alanyl-D-alanine carboxypeptidase